MELKNILVHKYGEINDSLTYRFLNEEQDDFNLFEGEIRAYLKSK